MSKLKALGIFLVGAVFFGSVAYGQSIPSQSPWVYNASNQITQIVANSVIKITGLSDGCLALSSSLLVSSGSPCGTGGGSTPGGTSGQVQYNANGTFGGVSTTTLVAGTNVTFSGGPVSVIGTSPLTINSSGGGTSFGYPFPGNATTTNITFTGGITGNVNGSITGNANTATALQTGRSINGVNFDGTQNITIFAASSTLLANNNTFSGNNIFSNIITGSISGSAGSVANAVTFNNSGSGAASGQTYNGSSAQTISYNTLGAQVSGNYITALTGDVTATGPGSVAATLATVNGNVGAFTNANITVNAKGLITAASNGAGSGSPFPFTPQTYGVSTSTTVGFLLGMFSTGSTTINGAFHLPLSNGELAVFGNLVSSGATTTAGTGLTYSGNAFNVNTTQNITTLSNLTTAGTVNTTASGALYSTATSSVTNGTGISFTGTPGALIGGTPLTITNSGVTSNVAGTGISVSGATGAVTITNTGVTSLGNGTGTTCSGTAPGTCNVNTTQNITTLSNLGSGTVNTNTGVLYNTSTSTPTVNAPITYSGTLGQFISGVSGAFGCTNASSGVTGCLTGTDWNTFNNKQASGFQISTTSPISQGNLSYFTGVTPTSLGGVATTTVSCGTGATCSTFTAIGSSPVTITASGSGGSAYPFTPTTNFGATSQATTGVLWLQNGLQASSTSQFGQGVFSGPVTGGIFLSTSTNSSVPSYSYTTDSDTGISGDNSNGLKFLGGGNAHFSLTASGPGSNYAFGPSFNSTFGPELVDTNGSDSVPSLYFTGSGYGLWYDGSIEVSGGAARIAQFTSNGVNVSKALSVANLSTLTGGFLSTASSTVNGQFAVSTSTLGCATFGAGGILYSTGSSCGTGGGTVTSVTGTYPIISSGGTTPAISLAFGTTTSNTWAGTQTFTNTPVFSTLGAGTVNSTSAGTIYNTATSSITNGTGISFTGTPGALVGGTNMSVFLSTIANGTVLANGSGSTASPVAIATSTLYGAASTGGFVLQWSNVTNGLVLAATSSSGGSGITAITGPTGLTFSGSPTSVGTLGTGFSIKELPTIVVAASGGDTNSIQTALNTCGTLGGANIVLTDPLYNIGGTGLTWKGSNCQIWGRGPGTTTISFTGATTAISASNIAACQANINVCYTQNEIHNVFFSGDGNASGVAIDWTDMSHGLVDDVQTSDVGTSLRVTDNQTSVGGVTFYNKFTNLDLNDNHKFCIDASSTNPVNGNTFDNIFCGDAATANVTGLNMNNGNGDLFNMIFMEPGSITGTIGMNIFDNTLSTNNGVFNNTFSNWYVEANATGIKIATTVHPSAGGIQRNTLSNMTVEANTTDWNVAAGAAVLNTINGYDSNFGAPITSLQGPVGISTSTELQAIGATPWAYLGVNASSSVSANEFVVDQNNASGQYRTDLLLNNTGYLGLGGSVTPSSRLTVTDQTTGDALLPTVLITGNTNFAKTGDLLKVSNNNGSDSGTTTQIINVGTGPSFEVDDQANDTTPFVVNAAGNVGIGSTTPNATLSINAVAQSNPFFEIGSTTSDLVSIKPSTSLAFGIGTSSPWRTLSVEGTVALHNLTTGTAGTPICINTSGEIVSAGGATCLTSSKYTKEDIQPLDLDALAETMKLQVKQFAYLDTPTVTHYGLIAEDVQQIDPDLVAHTAITMVLDGHTFNIGDPIAIDSEHLADGLLVKDIQQLQGEILTLQPGRDVEENWQWLVIGILVIWNISLTLRRRK